MINFHQVLEKSLRDLQLQNKLKDQRRNKETSSDSNINNNNNVKKFRKQVSPSGLILPAKARAIRALIYAQKTARKATVSSAQ